ncbi:para-nitrobenzyl esterase [Microbacterium phyllosphaerae]|nr:para-nitrobenzyl esterase [Microbacterium phyllosphaerae]
MVFVHGGSNQFGSHRDLVSDGAQLASKGVIVVAIQYRLGALGFLKVDQYLGNEYSESGALAVHDVVAALRWVHDHASTLGADTARVTLMGHSAGATLAATVAVSPLATGLIRRLIMQSGTGERVHDEEHSAALTDSLLAVSGLDPDELLTCDSSRLIEGQTKLSAQEKPRLGLLPMPFKCQLGTRAVPQSPLDAFRAGESDEIAFLAGTTWVEGAAFTDDFSPEEIRVAWDNVSCGMSSSSRSSYRRAAAELGDSTDDDRQALNQLLTDVQYRRPTDRLLSSRHGRHSTAATFGYVFDGRAVSTGALASAHGSELPFVFENVTHFTDPNIGATAYAVPAARQISTAWANFIIDGAPGPVSFWPSTSTEVPRLKVLGGPPSGDPRLDGADTTRDPWQSLRKLWASMENGATPR